MANLRRRKVERAEKIEESEEVKRSDLINKMVITVRDPSKKTEKICRQLRQEFRPNCLTRMEKNPRVGDCIATANQLLVGQIVLVSENEIKIGIVPDGPTLTFRIVEYEDNFKNFSPDLYKLPAFITFDGKSSLKPIFEGLGKNEVGFKRVLHFCFDGDLIHIRHYHTTTENLDDSLRMSLREIGPRMTLKLKEEEKGLFPEYKKMGGYK